VAPWLPGAAQEVVAIRHSASVPPWADGDVHLHTEAEEYFFLFQGELRLLVAGAALTLRPYEALMVRPGVPHAVVGGSGPIEHFVLRMPARHDRQSQGPLSPGPLLEVDESRRAFESDWGCRVPLAEAKYQNCWLFGVGQAHFPSDQICLAYLHFPTTETVAADGHPHRLHLHRASWEYYTVLRGRRVIQVEEELVEISEGEILAVPPQAKHVLHATHTPFEGFTFRVPRLDDKVEV
jgi:mannose-6-phosphate isomerase-like protein (cupin superfamily)